MGYTANAFYHRPQTTSEFIVVNNHIILYKLYSTML